MEPLRLAYGRPHITPFATAAKPTPCDPAFLLETPKNASQALPLNFSALFRPL